MADKILIVDDDPVLREELREFLDGYEVEVASNGEEALGYFKRAHSFGLVLLDVRMPGKSGLDVLGEIKKSDPRVKIIILTGHSSKDMAIEALKGRADDYVEKPVIASKIRETVESLLGSGSRHSELSRVDGEGIVAKIKRFVEINCYKKTTLEDAAKVVCLSPKYLSRVFKERARMSFNTYRLRVKMEKAKELLVRFGYNVNQVSDKLAYENPESFIRQFKKITGKTPSRYRNDLSKKKSKRRILRRK